jgi:aspartyl-tRNA(Asn)/glutamyl-tRNA(Gln) amidotransferase subunit A
MDSSVVARIAQGAEIADCDYAAALAARADDRAQELARWGEADVLLMPATPCIAPPFAAVDEGVPRLARFTRLANWLDLPAAVIPVMLSPEGLPVAVQIVGRPSGEAAVVAAGKLIERARGRFPQPSQFAATEAAA